MASRRRIAVVAAGLFAAVVLAIVYWSGGRRESPPFADAPLATGVDRTDGVSHDTASRTSRPLPETSPPNVSPEDDLYDLARLCSDLWGDPGEPCLEALEARFGKENTLAGAARSPADWSRHRAEVRARSSLIASLDVPTLAEVFDDPSAIRRAVGIALAKPECVVGEGQMRPRLRERCAADDMAKLAMLQAACVPLLWQDRAYREAGMHDAFAEGWRSAIAATAEEPDHETYLRLVAEMEEERFRFAWRLHRCRAVPDDALAWVDAFRVPDDHSGADQSLALDVNAARLGTEWAAPFGMAASQQDMAVLRRWDPALASLVEATLVTDLEKSPLGHLIAAVELSHRDGKAWHRDALETLTQRYTAEEIRQALPDVAARIGFEPVVLGDL